MANLMDLSLEMRIQIFTQVFRGLSNNNGLVLYNNHYIRDDLRPFTNWPEPKGRIDRNFRWAALEYETSHPLLLTCKQFRWEALGCF